MFLKIRCNRLTTLPLVSGYDEVRHDVEDCKQEEANLKMITEYLKAYTFLDSKIQFHADVHNSASTKGLKSIDVSVYKL